MRPTRRQFFWIAGSGALMAADREKRDMMVRSTRPEDLEMPLAGFSDYITPIEHFFVRTHVYVPTVNADEWRLNVAGEVATPLTLTMEDVRKLPATELVAVAECAGNGRSLFDPPMSGAQWNTGAVGNGRWRGVRLADVLRRAGIKQSGREVLFDGADVPIGKMQDFRRSIPVKKALDPNTLLAYEMNGETLPVKHGFPLRVVAPGWASDSWVKWVTSLTVLDKEFDGFWMKNAYRRPDHPVAPGTVLTPEQMVPVTSLRVKSVIAAPAEGSTAAPGKSVTIRGAAWGGDAGPVTAVDVSVDAGRTWKPAQLGRERSQFGWRQWEYGWTPKKEGFHTVMARAHDASGDSQPLAQEWNPSGYGYNVATHIHVDVTEKPAAGLAAAAGTGAREGGPEAPASMRGTCLVCHEENMISQERLTRGQWDRELNKMTGFGAQVKPEDREALLNYLSSKYGVR